MYPRLFFLTSNGLWRLTEARLDYQRDLQTSFSLKSDMYWPHKINRENARGNKLYPFESDCNRHRYVGEIFEWKDSGESGLKSVDRDTWWKRNNRCRLGIVRTATIRSLRSVEKRQLISLTLWHGQNKKTKRYSKRKLRIGYKWWVAK